MLMTRVCALNQGFIPVNEALNEDLSCLDAWLISNKLSLNVAKTQSMLLLPKLKGKPLLSLTKLYKSILMERGLKLLAKLSNLEYF